MGIKIVFLDIEGVLNSVRTVVAHNKLLPYHQIQEKSLDPIAVDLLQVLCGKTHAKVVMTSTWRLRKTKQDFIDIFEHYGWRNFPIIGYTPYLATHRGVEIADWIDSYSQLNHSDPIDQYVILDDSSDMLLGQMDHLVHTNLANGLLLTDYIKALRILDPNHPDLHPTSLGGYC